MAGDPTQAQLQNGATDLVELRVGRSEANETSDAVGERERQLGRIVNIGQRQVGQLLAEPAEEVVDRRVPQRVLGLEVVIDLGLVSASMPWDTPDADASV